MGSLGLREWAAIAALLAAAVIAITFIDPTSGGSDRQGSSKASPTAGRKATLGPPRPLPQPPLWSVGFHDITADGASRLDGQGVLEKLDMSYPGAPFGTLRDDSWKVVAEAPFSAAEGQYDFSVEHDCELRISVNEEEVAADPDSQAAATVRVSFTHAGGTGSIKVECRDRGGPFLLRWKDG
jgi:hypothetical protein